MPKKTKTGAGGPLPSTLERSPKKARDTYEETLESAERSYDGDEARAHRAAWASVKHSFEKVGDHWEPKDERGPSDARAAQRGPDAGGRSYGGFDASGRSKDELLAEARRRGVHATTRMTKDQLADELAHANDRETRAARGR